MRSVELFAGGGGLLIGSHFAGFQAEVAAEWDRWACDTLRQNQAAGHPAIATSNEPTPPWRGSNEPGEP